jgi:hypothetical protein
VRERERFEEWVRNQRQYILSLEMGGAETYYVKEPTDIAWTAWQAAIASRETIAEPVRRKL